MKKTLHCRRAGFEPQRTSSFRKRVKAHQVLGEAVRARTAIPHFLLLITLWWCWRALSAAIAFFLGIVSLCRPPPYQDRGRARAAGNRFSRDEKNRGPSRGRSNYPESGLINPPRRDTRALSPAGMFGGKAPPHLAAQKSRPHAHLKPMRGAPAYFLCKWGV